MKILGKTNAIKCAFTLAGCSTCVEPDEFNK